MKLLSKFDDWALGWALKHHLFEENKALADALPQPALREGEKLRCLLLATQKAFQQNAPSASLLEKTLRDYLEQVFIFNEALEAIPPIFLPALQVQGEKTAWVELIQALHHTWPTLVRKTQPEKVSSLLPLPFPYMVPGGRFSEMYYWDSYFTLLGLKISGLEQLAQGMVDNCLYLIEQYGHVPNGNRSYYLSRSQPPFLTAMIQLAPLKNNLQWLERTFNLAKKEYEGFWMNPETRWLDAYGLNRYYDTQPIQRPESWGTDNLETPNTPEFYRHERAECESGWDFTDRFQGRCADFLPIDLNCLLYRYETDFACFARQLKLKDEALAWEKTAQNRWEKIQTFLWDDVHGMFFDFDTQPQSLEACWPSWTLASFFALWAGVATPAQASRLIENLTQFEAPGGLMTTLSDSSKQWGDRRNGWAPLHWIVIEGLQRYGAPEKAHQIGQRWVEMVTNVYQKTGKFYEKYNVVACNLETVGGYPLQEGFGWTNGATLAMLAHVLGYSVVPTATPFE